MARTFEREHEPLDRASEEPKRRKLRSVPSGTVRPAAHGFVVFQRVVSLLSSYPGSRRPPVLFRDRSSLSRLANDRVNKGNKFRHRRHPAIPLGDKRVFTRRANDNSPTGRNTFLAAPCLLAEIGFL